MSVRAYRVIEIQKAGESFNLWYDNEITEWLARNTSFFEPMIDGTGLTEVSVEDLEEMLKEIGDKISEDVKGNLIRDIEITKKRGESYVTYYCY